MQGLNFYLNFYTSLYLILLRMRKELSHMQRHWVFRDIVTLRNVLIIRVSAEDIHRGLHVASRGFVFDKASVPNLPAIRMRSNNDVALVTNKKIINKWKPHFAKLFASLLTFLSHFYLIKNLFENYALSLWEMFVIFQSAFRECI